MVSIGPRIRIDGETHFRQALQQIYHSVSNVKKEMDLMTLSFKKNESAMSKNRKTSELLERTIGELTTKLQFQRSAYDQSFLQINEVQKKYLKLTEKIKTEHIPTVEAAKKKWEEMTAAHGKDSKEAKEAKERYDDLNHTLKSANSRADSYVREVARLNTAQDEMRGRMLDTEIELKKYQEELKKVPNALQTIGSQLEESGEKLSEWGNTLSKYVTAPLAALGTYSVKQAATFEDGMAKIYTIALESTEPMAKMREELLQLSNDTGYAIEDLAEAAYQAVSASVAADDAVEFLGEATKLARGGFTTTTQAVDLLTTVINAYGMEAKNAARINDILLKTQNDGKTIIDELAQSMGTVIPTAANYNISLEQLAGAYATMTKQGVNTARSTTFLNAMFTELEKESSDVAKILDSETGMSFAQLMDSGMSLADVLRILYDAVGNDNEEFQKLFGNIRSGKAAAALINNDFQTLTDEINAMYEATGQTNYALETLQTPALKAKIALNQLKNSAVDIGAVMINDFYPVFKDVVDAIKDGTTWFHNLDDGVKSTIVKFGLLAAAMGPAFKILGGGIKIVGSAFGKIGELQKTLIATSTALGGASTTSGALFAGLATGLPIVLGATAAFTGVAIATEKMMEADREAINQKYGLTEAMQQNINKITEYETTIDEYRDSVSQTIEGIELQTEQTKALVEEYNNLIGSNGEVKEGNEEMADKIIEELAVALGIEKEKVKELIDENGKFGESMDIVIEKMEQEAKVAAYRDYYVEAMKKQIGATKNLEELQGRLATATTIAKEKEDEMNEAIALYNQHLGESPDIVENYKNAMNRAIEENSRAQATVSALKDAEKEAQTQVKQLSNDQEYYMRKIADITGQKMDEAEDAFTDNVKKMSDAITTYLYDMDPESWSYNIALGMAKYLEKYSYLPVNAAADLARRVDQTMRYKLEINSPSKKAERIGKYFVEGFVEGMESMSREAENMASALANVSSSNLQEGYVSNNNYKNISAPISVNVSVNGNVDDVDALARTVAERISDALNRESEVFA